MNISLDALLQRATATVEAKAAKAKLTGPKAAAGALTKTEREALELKLRQWENEHEYTRTALTFMVNLYVCSCGAQHHGSGQIFIHEVHKRVAGTQRYTRAIAPYPEDLPKEWLWQRHHVDFCTDCAQEMGFVRTMP